VCCLERFYDHYTTLQEFGEYISDANLPLQAAIDNQGACTRLDSPPSNYTNRLLNTTHDFVNGSFARMVRSYSRLDPTVSRGYQDILLFLALEDVQNLAAVRTELVSPTGLGDRFRFFVGMAHIKTLESNRLAVSSSQVEINADITTSYVYTTKTSTDFTFIRDVSVQLREVRRAGTLANSTTTKFATITIIVPETVTAEDAITIIPPLSLQVGVGYLANLVTTKVYPCENTYTGATKNTIDTLLADQSYCALQDPICSAQGPVAVGPGGSIQFTFPLEDTAWSATDLAEDARLRRSLFIDFMVSVIDQDGKRLVTNLKTNTVLQRPSILTMCTDTVELESSVEELLTLDIFLGLVGQDADFDSALVKNEDATRQTNPQNMRRDISSKASNVMTVLVKGDAAMFDQAFAREYTLAVEDIITLHFLNADKLEAVRLLMDNGAAFTQVRGTGSELSIMKLVPSDALLALCPLQAIAGRYGCVARREVAARGVDARATSIVNIAPNDATDLFNVSTNAGAWTSNLLGNSEYATQLGFNHSSIMNTRYNLNARYRRGFMISPTTPWRAREMEAAGIDSVLDLSQITITVMLMSFDANINDVYVSTVPGGMPPPAPPPPAPPPPAPPPPAPSFPEFRGRGFDSSLDVWTAAGVKRWVLGGVKMSCTTACSDVQLHCDESLSTDVFENVRSVQMHALVDSHANTTGENTVCTWIFDVWDEFPANFPLAPFMFQGVCSLPRAGQASNFLCASRVTTMDERRMCPCTAIPTPGPPGVRRLLSANTGIRACKCT